MTCPPQLCNDSAIKAAICRGEKLSVLTDQGTMKPGKWACPFDVFHECHISLRRNGATGKPRESWHDPQLGNIAINDHMKGIVYLTRK